MNLLQKLSSPNTWAARSLLRQIREEELMHSRLNELRAQNHLSTVHGINGDAYFAVKNIAVKNKWIHMGDINEARTKEDPDPVKNLDLFSLTDDGNEVLGTGAFTFYCEYIAPKNNVIIALLAGIFGSVAWPLLQLFWEFGKLGYQILFG